jgi:putative Mn2+ efflux pump MntP
MEQAMTTVNRVDEPLFGGRQRAGWSRDDMQPQLLAAWSGIGAVVLCALGLIAIAQFIPPQDPTASAEHIANWYAANALRIRIGLFVTMIGVTLFVPFGIVIALQTRRSENRPIMTAIQIACIAIGTLEGIIAMFVWAAAAFRAGQIAPELTRLINDLGWFAFMFDVPPFSLWVSAIAYTILRDRNPQPVFPRWVAYFNIWLACLFLPADAMAFFKTGPFAWNGLLCLYIPVGFFFVWILVMTPVVLQAIRREADAH